MNRLDEALGVLASVRLPNGRRWGDAAVTVQVSDARALLDDASPVRRHLILRSRGYGKTFDGAATTAAAMVTQAPRGARLYTAAADRDQARLVVDAFAGIVARTEELTGAFVVEQWRVIVPRTDIVLEVLSSDSATAFGRTPWWLVIDELCQWPATPDAQRFYEALSTALPKRADSRALLISTPGDPTHWSHRVYETALGEPELWQVSETHGPAPWIAPRLVRAEERRLPASSFRRWWLGEIGRAHV